VNGLARATTTIVILAMLSAAGLACTHVAPYQRGRLAHPTMTPDEQVNPAVAHVNSVQEGATGGAAGAESGCGCN